MQTIIMQDTIALSISIMGMFAVIVLVLSNVVDYLNPYTEEEVERYTKFTGCEDDIELYTVIRYKRTYKNGTITYISKRD